MFGKRRQGWADRCMENHKHTVIPCNECEYSNFMDYAIPAVYMGLPRPFMECGVTGKLWALDTRDCERKFMPCPLNPKKPGRIIRPEQPDTRSKSRREDYHYRQAVAIGEMSGFGKIGLRGIGFDSWY